MLILGIETSCDETSVAVLKAGGGLDAPHFDVLSNIVSSQVALHSEHGGVVPNIAKREHIKNLPVVYKQALDEASNDRTSDVLSFDAVAVTVGPGLEPALWTGINFAKELAKELGKPLVAVNHMAGHIASVLLQQNTGSSKSKAQNPKFPAIALLVSGGHTELVRVAGWGEYRIVGETRDDAVGEAFDKVARMLGLSYPGGPEISRLAETVQPPTLNSSLPRPMLNSGDYDFSFSGLKTAVLYYLRDNPNADKAEVAHEFQQAVIDVLVSKTIRAAKGYNARSIILGGGVANNKELRRQLADAVKGGIPNSYFLIPNSSYTTDNAAMIAAAGYIEYIHGNVATGPDSLTAQGTLRLGT